LQGAHLVGTSRRARKNKWRADARKQHCGDG